MANANAPAIVTAGQVVEIVGVQCGDGGRSCGAHDIGAGSRSRSLSPFDTTELSPYDVSSDDLQTRARPSSTSRLSESETDDKHRRQKKHKKRSKKSKRKKERDNQVYKLSEFMGKKKDEGPRSMITGKLIKMKVKKSREEKAAEKNRKDLLEFLNEAA